MCFRLQNLIQSLSFPLLLDGSCDLFSRLAALIGSIFLKTLYNTCFVFAYRQHAVLNSDKIRRCGDTRVLFIHSPSLMQFYALHIFASNFCRSQFDPIFPTTMIIFNEQHQPTDYTLARIINKHRIIQNLLSILCDFFQLRESFDIPLRDFGDAFQLCSIYVEYLKVVARILKKHFNTCCLENSAKFLEQRDIATAAAALYSNMTSMYWCASILI